MTTSIQTYDANHNGYPELYYYTTQWPYIYFIRICEYRPYNRYLFVDTIYGKHFHAVGDFDRDGKVDLLGSWGGLLYVFEQKFPDAYPTYQVWRSDSTSSGGGIHIADLDQDGRIDFLTSNPPQVYENIGNNDYAFVWSDDSAIAACYNYTSGDFDQDGKTEFVGGDIGSVIRAVVYECVGDNQYQFVFCDTSYPSAAHSHDVWFGNDLDQDGKLEFIICSCPPIGGSWAYQFRVYEATGDNTYEVSYASNIVYRPANLRAGRGSYCGDVDCDGVDEIIWAVQDNWYIYKAFGNNNFKRVFTAYPEYNGRDQTRVYVYDINGNGYPEIIESGSKGSGSNFWSETIIWEIEAVRLSYPNGGEVFNPGDTVEIRWRSFDPPGCDSLSLFFSADSGYTYDTITTGIPAQDTTYRWVVPDTLSDECMLMIWAYGPGTGWDFTDSTFAIGVRISEPKSHKFRELKIHPNPSHGLVNLALPADVINLTLFDASGRLIHRLSPLPHLQLTLPPGIYFLKIKTQSETKTEKLVVLR